MSSSKLSKSGKGPAEHGDNYHTANQESQYTDRASKQLAEKIAARNRAEPDSKSGKAPASKNEGRAITEGEQAVRKRRKRDDDQWSMVVNTGKPLPAGPFHSIEDHYKAGPGALKDYVSRTYLPWNQISGIDQEAVEAKLKTLLDKVRQFSNAEWMEWRHLPLPQQVIRQERETGKSGLLFGDMLVVANSVQIDDDEDDEVDVEQLRIAYGWKQGEREQKNEMDRMKPLRREREKKKQKTKEAVGAEAGA